MRNQPTRKPNSLNRSQLHTPENLKLSQLVAWASVLLKHGWKTYPDMTGAYYWQSPRGCRFRSWARDTPTFDAIYNAVNNGDILGWEIGFNERGVCIRRNSLEFVPSVLEN